MRNTHEKHTRGGERGENVRGKRWRTNEWIARFDATRRTRPSRTTGRAYMPAPRPPPLGARAQDRKPRAAPESAIAAPDLASNYDEDITASFSPIYLFWMKTVVDLTIDLSSTRNFMFYASQRHISGNDITGFLKKRNEVQFPDLFCF